VSSEQFSPNKNYVKYKTQRSVKIITENYTVIWQHQLESISTSPTEMQLLVSIHRFTSSNQSVFLANDTFLVRALNSRRYARLSSSVFVSFKVWPFITWSDLEYNKYNYFNILSWSQVSSKVWSYRSVFRRI